MTVRRGLLYTGVFLVAAGGVTLLAASGALDRGLVADALAYWPLAVIAIGLGLLLRRTPAAIPGGMLAAATPGLLFGGMLVSAPDLPTPCVEPGGAPGATQTRQGSFAGDATVDLELACGNLRVTTDAGDAWRLDSRHADSRTTDVVASDGRLAVSTAEHRVRWGSEPGAVDWDLVLPTGRRLDLDLTISAGRGAVDLTGSQLGRAAFDVNAGDVRVDLTGAALDRLDLAVNAASATLVLPVDDFAGEVDANAAAVDLCVPDGLGLRVTGSAALGSIDHDGLVRRGDTWETPGYATAQHRADLTVSANVGSIDITTEGACK